MGCLTLPFPNLLMACFHREQPSLLSRMPDKGTILIGVWLRKENEYKDLENQPASSQMASIFFFSFVSKIEDDSKQVVREYWLSCNMKLYYLWFGGHKSQKDLKELSTTGIIKLLLETYLHEQGFLLYISHTKKEYNCSWNSFYSDSKEYLFMNKWTTLKKNKPSPFISLGNASPVKSGFYACFNF